jgi:hypothetical protein
MISSRRFLVASLPAAVVAAIGTDRRLSMDAASRGWARGTWRSIVAAVVVLVAGAGGR